MAERKLVIRMEAETAKLRAGMKTASASTRSFGQSIEQGITRHAAGIRMTGIAIAGLGAAMTAMAVLSVKAAADFGAELANVSTMLDETAMHLMPEYSDQLREMSKDFGESTKTLSKGLYDILSASIPPAEALNVLAISAKAAVAGITDTGVAADAITTIINAYGLAAKDASDVSDWLFTVVKRGKCVTGDTRILLSDGRYKRIDSLSGSIEIVSWDYRNFIPMQAEFVDMGIKQTVDLATASGRKIGTTPEHPYLTPEGWKPVKDLREGDRIALPSSLPFFGHTKAKDGWPELLGYLIAEGSLQYGSPSLAIGNPDILAKVQDAAQRFGIDLRKINQSDSDKCPLYILATNRRGGHQKNPVIEILKRYGLWGSNAHTKFVPSQVFTWTRNDISKFLRAYFNGDGWLSEKKSTHQFQLGCCSMSRRLLEDISHLLLRFGINGYIRHHSFNSWIWETKRYVEIKRFLDFIGIDRLSTQDFLGKILQPRGNKKYLTSAMGSRRKKSKFRPYEGLILTDNQLYYDRIKTIEYKKEEHVYDLIVPKLHNFVANDILAHNTTFAELAPAIGKVSTVANMAGVSINELGAMIATLTRAGIKTDQAMTAVLGVLRTFLKASDEGAKTAEVFGVTLDTNTLRTEGLVGVMKKLVDAESEQLAQIFPNIRGLIAFSAALGDAEGFTEDLDFMLNRTGKTQEALEKITGSVAFQFGQLKMEFADVTRALGLELIPIIKKDFLPMAKDLANRLQNLVKWFAKLPESTKKFAMELGPLLMALGGLVAILPTATRMITAMGLAFGGATVAVAGGVGALVILWTKWEETWAKYAASVAGAIIPIVKLIEGAGGFIPVLKKMVAYNEFTGRVIVGAWMSLGTNMVNWASWILTNVPSAFTTMSDTILGIIVRLMDNIGAHIEYGIALLKSIFTREKIEPPNWEPILHDVEWVFTEIPRLIGVGMGEAKEELDAALKGIDDAFKETGETVEETADTFRDVTEATEEVKKVAAELWHIMEYVTDVYARGISTFIGTTKITKELKIASAELWHVMEGVGNAYERGISIFKGYIDEIKELLIVTAELWHITEGIGNAYKKGISTFKGYIPKVEKLRIVFAELWHVMEGVGNAYERGISIFKGYIPEATKLRTVTAELWHMTEGVGNAYERGISVFVGYIEKTKETRRVVAELWHEMETAGGIARTMRLKLNEAWKGFSTEVWVTFKAIALEKLGLLGDAILAFAAIVKGNLMEGAISLGQVFANVAMSLLDSFFGLITETDAYKELMEILKPVIQAAIDILNAFLQPFLPIIRVLVDAFLPIIEALTPVFEALGTIIASMLIPILKALWPVIKYNMWLLAKFGEALAYAWMVIAKLFGLAGYHAAKEMIKAMGDLADTIWDMENPFDNLTKAIEESTEASIAETEHKRLGTQATRDFFNKLGSVSDRLQTFDLGNLISPVDFGDYVSGVNLGDFVGGVNLADFIESIPHAQVGIPYVPRTMPVIVEREEAILSPLQARAWRGGEGGARVEQNIGPINIIVEGAKVEDPVYWDGIVRNYINPAIERNAGRRTE